jgi:hypothetical protein
MSTSPRARHPCLIQKHGKPAASIVFVHEALAVAVLATCREVYSEASVIAQTALRALQQRPKKMIITTSAMDAGILDIFIHLSGSTKDLRRLTQISPRAMHWGVEGKKEPQPTLQTTQVQIAIRNEFEKQPFGDHGTTEDLWSYLRMYILRLHYDKLLYEAQELRSQEQWRPSRNLDVTFRMALMSPIEKEEFETEQWFDSSIMFDGRYFLQIQGGEQLEASGWEEDWATSATPSESVMDGPQKDWVTFLPASTCAVSMTRGIAPVLSGRRRSVSKLDRLLQATSKRWKAVYGRWSGRGWLN